MSNINCAILAIGSELLEGSVIDTNSAFIGSNLSLMGIKPQLVCSIPDNKEQLINTIKELSLNYDIILTTGGLGPTFDDITSECISIVANIDREVNETALNHIKKRLNEINVTLRDSHINQALLPKNAILFKNIVGTAYGFGVFVNKSLIIAMPGVPAEMTVMFEEEVKPYIEKNYNLEKIYRKELHFGLLPESDVDKILREYNIPDNIECIINAGKSEIAVKIKSSNKKVVEDLSNHLINHFKDNFMGDDVYSPAEALIKILRDNNKTISVAESCTGGYLGKTITEYSGVSDVFLGGIISYSNDIKINLLKVDSEVLNKYGAVSSQVAEAMSKGAIIATGADFAISITGIAGPTGGVEDKPVGTVYIGISNGKKTISYHFCFKGKRDIVRHRSVNASLFLAYKFIMDNINE